MSEATPYVLLALGFSVLLLWLMRRRPKSAIGDRSAIDQNYLEGALPYHYRFFPQVRQALSAGDYQYLCGVVPPRIARQVLRERREVARRFLSGLHEDFSRLERLARMVAALSPVISREQETERFLLGLRFRLLYGVVWISLSSGRVPLQQIEDLTGLVGRLALRMEQGMAAINALTAQRVPRQLNA